MYQSDLIKSKTFRDSDILSTKSVDNPVCRSGHVIALSPIYSGHLTIVQLEKGQSGILKIVC